MKKTHNPELIARLAAAAPYLVALRDKRSFTKAAAEFDLHQTALSHRLRGLEDAIGQKLFERTTRSLNLTEAGDLVCKAADATMSEWTHVLDSLSEQKLSNRVTLSLPSSLALKWIVPALPRAQEAGLDLSLEVQDEVVSPKSAGSHVTIRFGRGPYPGFFVSHLSNCDLWPVARPGVVQSKSIRDADASGKIRFLKDKRGELDGTDYCWSAYFQGLEKDDTEVGSGLYFERADLMLQAAIGGMGVALGRTLLIENDLNDGFLEIVGPPARIPSKYWVVTTSEFAQTEVFPKLLHWLRQEIVRTRRTISSAQPEQ